MSATATPARQPAVDDGLDPVGLVKSLTALVRSTGLYPAGHTVIQQALAALEAALQSPVRAKMRADFARFPPYRGPVTHYPMLSFEPWQKT